MCILSASVCVCIQSAGVCVCVFVLRPHVLCSLFVTSLPFSVAAPMLCSP